MLYWCCHRTIRWDLMIAIDQTMHCQVHTVKVSIYCHSLNDDFQTEISRAHAQWKVCSGLHYFSQKGLIGNSLWNTNLLNVSFPARSYDLSRLWKPVSFVVYIQYNTSLTQKNFIWSSSVIETSSSHSKDPVHRRAFLWIKPNNHFVFQPEILKRKWNQRF